MVFQIVDALTGIRDELRIIRALMEPQPTARIALPDRCMVIDASRCALQDDDARREIGNFSDPNRWLCIGCGVRSEAAEPHVNQSQTEER